MLWAHRKKRHQNRIHLIYGWRKTPAGGWYHAPQLWEGATSKSVSKLFWLFYNRLCLTILSKSLLAYMQRSFFIHNIVLWSILPRQFRTIQRICIEHVLVSWIASNTKMLIKFISSNFEKLIGNWRLPTMSSIN